MDKKIQSEPAASELGGVIWITGYSGSGKTTVGRKVINDLREHGVHAIHLDGDDLRSIFGNHWGYERNNRIELAHVYFRFCSHLASQDMTVVISATAMYEDVRNWVQTFIPNSVVAYLRVPEEERIRRDQNTKRIYSDLKNISDLYDAPETVNLIIDNHGGVSPDDAADEIVEFYLQPRRKVADKGKTSYWEDYYKNNEGSLEPSPFAQSVSSGIPDAVSILEVGCGNGRDTVYFSSQGHQVVALDASEAAIDLCRQVHKDIPVAFSANTAATFRSKHTTSFDCIYSRFVLHAMTLEEEGEFLSASRQLLKPGGQLYIECRSILDPMSRKGEVISPTERVFGHYRRFIVNEDLVKRVNEAGLDIVQVEESNGLAKFGEEDPVVIRLTAGKP